MKKTKKILIVEDEKPMANALNAKFNHTDGFEAKTAGNGEEALKILKKEKFDLILTDLIMPKMDGFALVSKLYKEGNKIPIIISSNLSQQEDLEKMKSLGVKDYFVKSNTPITEVINHVKKVLNI